MKIDFEETIELPEGVTVEEKDWILTVTGPEGSVKRKRTAPQIQVDISDDKVVLSASKGTKREKTALNTLKAHLKNMVRGVQDPWTYKLKVCSSHFPMSVKMQGTEFSITNLIGEKIPRTINLPAEADVQINGDEIVVSSPDVELAGRTASDIENLARITDLDRRIFQDGIFITEKKGTKVRTV